MLYTEDGMKTFEMKEPPDFERCSTELHGYTLRKKENQPENHLETHIFERLFRTLQQGRMPFMTEIRSQGKGVLKFIGSPRLDTHRTRLKGENHKHSVKVRFQKEETSKTKSCATIKKYLWMLLLFGMLANVHGSGTEPYPPAVHQSVQMGDAIKITEVQSEDCEVRLELCNGTEIPRCSQAYPQEKCTFLNGIFTPDPCFNLEYEDGVIWKTNITAPFSFCADHICSYPVKCGQISLDTRRSSVSTTPAPTTQHTPTSRENTTEDSTRVKSVLPLIAAIVSVCLILCFIGFIGFIAHYCNKSQERKKASACGISDIWSFTPASDGSAEEPLSDSASSGISSQSE